VISSFLMQDGVPNKQSLFDHRAVDTHAHVFSPFVRIPEGPGYKPSPALLRTQEEYYGVLKGHGVTGGLLVQPSTYLTDNSVMLDAIQAAPDRNIKGIAALEVDVDDGELGRLERCGIVGVRLDLINSGPVLLKEPRLASLLERLRERDWWTELYVRGSDFPKYEPLVRRHAGKVIFDAIGRPDVERGIDEPGFQRLLAFGREGPHAMKLSGPVSTSAENFPYADVDRFVRAVVDAFGIENCTWGSDWPFGHPRSRHNYQQMLEWLFGLIDDPRDRRRVLWDNPARLFGFR
jgi:predicted TIM-barrel fold metal-dependent hydrolase